MDLTRWRELHWPFGELMRQKPTTEVLGACAHHDTGAGFTEILSD